MHGFRSIRTLFRNVMTFPPPRLGVVLGGGGARGLAHVGVLKVLDEAGIRPEIVVGTSMGGLVGGAYATRMSLPEMEAEALKLAETNRLIQLADRIPTLKALFSGNRIEHYLKELVGEDSTFADLKIPFAVVAVDLNKAEEVVLSKGPLVPALRATMSIPGVFAPIELDDKRLIDGGFLNNVPVNVARNLGADIVLAVNVMPRPSDPPLEPLIGLPGMKDLLEAALLTGAVMTERNLKDFPPDVLVRPAVPESVNLLTGFPHAEDTIKAGVLAMQIALPQLQEIIKRRT